MASDSTAAPRQIKEDHSINTFQLSPISQRPMFANRYAQISPMTPPPPLMYDGVSIVQPDMSEWDYDMPQDQPCYQHHPPSAISIPSLITPSYRPSPVVVDQRPSRLRSSYEATTPGLDSDDSEEFAQQRSVDMNMAANDSEAARAGIHTPLALYAAQMAVWLWHGQHPKSSSHSTSVLNSPNPFNTSPVSSPINTLQVAPSQEFSAFVENLLRITKVSHSVTLIALLYIYRLKMRNIIQGEAGSEVRPFVVSLILGNKYLDDNTYTNKTWSELSGIDLLELNRMEKEFLRGLSYELGVVKEEYQHWKHLLDGFIIARQKEASQAALARSRPAWSPQAQAFFNPPAFSYSPVAPQPSAYQRARSASPPQLVSPRTAHAYAYPSPSRKRTAVDAFAADFPGSSATYEQMRLPPRKANFGSMDATHSRSRSPSVLGRSSSLSRQIARLPSGEHVRRGSMGHLFVPTAEKTDLRHTAAMHWQQEHSLQQAGTGAGCSALIAPYQGAPHVDANAVPEHLMFYTLAAEPHVGPDGQVRKAILRYQNPTPAYGYPAPPPATYPVHDEAMHSNEYAIPPPTYGHVAPQPAQFANAGPPGYAYDPTYHLHQSRGSLDGQYPQVQTTYRTRSQWSSPVHPATAVWPPYGH